MAADVAWLAFKAAGALPALYVKSWMKDIDDGLVEWSRVSHKVAVALMFNSQKTSNWSAAADALGKFKPTLASMLGAPDVVAKIISWVQAFKDLFKPIEAIIDKIKKAVLDWLLQKATGMTLAELKAYYVSPHALLNQVFANNAMLATINKEMNVADSGWTNPNLTFDSNKFPDSTRSR